MADVFISYSRRDIAFARLLHEALKENQLETWIDWQDIPPSVDWLAEVYEAIEGADAFVFVISETSLSSEICGLEIAHAAKHNKRLIPIVIKDVKAEKVPKELAVLNWIYFEESGEKFVNAMRDLVTAITVDHEWVKAHTRLENRALAWDRKEKDRGLLLRGSDLASAENWLAGSAGKDPQPTALQTQFILKSREDATRRQRLTLMGIGAGLLIAIGLGIFAWTQRNVAVAEGFARATAQFEAVAESEMRATAQADAEIAQQVAEEAQIQAEEERDRAISRQLAIQSSQELENGRYEIGLLLAIESLKKSNTSEAFSAIRNTFDQGGSLIKIIQGPDSFNSVQWNGDESLILAAVDDYGARVWNVKTGEEVLVLDGHGGNIHQALWSSDESRIATRGGDGTAIIWDAESGARLWTITGHSGSGVTIVLWNKDSSRILSTGSNDQDTCYFGKCDSGSARLWKGETGEELLTFTSQTGMISWAKWNADETQIMLFEVDGQKGVVRVYDSGTGQEIFALTGIQSWVDDADWSQDESRILTLERSGTARVWDAEDGQILFQLPSPDSELRIDKAVWSPDGDQILTISCAETAASHPGCVLGFGQLWDGRTGDELFRLDGDQGAVQDAIWSRDGDRIFTSGDDGSVLAWNPVTGSQSMAFVGQLTSVSQLLESPDGTLLFASSVGRNLTPTDAVVWEIETGSKVMTLEGGTYGIRDAIWSLNSSNLLTYAGETARVWQIAENAELPIIDAYPGGVDHISWNQDGTQILTAGCDEENLSGKCLQGTVRIWDAETGIELMAFSGHTSRVVDAVWNDNETRLITASWDKTARVWDALSGDELLLLEGHSDWVTHVRWSPDENQILTASLNAFKDESARIWDAETGEMLLSIPAISMDHMEWNQTGSVLYALLNDDLRVLDPNTGAELAKIEDIGDYSRLAVREDERYAATGNWDGVIKIWDLETLAEVHQMEGHTGSVRDLSWNGDGTRLVSASLDGTARVWDSATGEEILRLGGHSAGLDGAYWNTDGSMILTISRDTTARVWDALTGDELTLLSGHSADITMASWNHNDSRIITASADNIVRQWYMSPQDLLAYACELAPRNLTSEEWQRYFGNTPCDPSCSSVPDVCSFEE